MLNSIMPIHAFLYRLPKPKHPVYTMFGDMNWNFPQIGENLPGTHVRSYVCGVFDVDADLANCTPSQVRCGVIYHGTETEGHVQLIINGQIYGEQTINGAGFIGLSWETAINAYGEQISEHVPLYFLEISWTDMLGDGGYIGYYHSNGDAFKSFTSDNCKFAVYVDQNTGLPEGTVDERYSSRIGFDIPMMYTSPKVPGFFSWDTILANVTVSDETSAYSTHFNQTHEVDLNVNLGGFAQSWTHTGTWAGWPRITYDLALPKTSGQTISLNGGKYFTDTDWYDNWRLTGMFSISGAHADKYVVSDQLLVTEAAIGVAVAQAGLRKYPGIATNHVWWKGGSIEALNFGKPVLFEMWYSTDKLASVPYVPDPIPLIDSSAYVYKSIAVTDHGGTKGGYVLALKNDSTVENVRGDLISPPAQALTNVRAIDADANGTNLSVTNDNQLILWTTDGTKTALIASLSELINTTVGALSINDAKFAKNAVVVLSTTGIVFTFDFTTVATYLGNSSAFASNVVSISADPTVTHVAMLQPDGTLFVRTVALAELIDTNTSLPIVTPTSVSKVSVRTTGFCILKADGTLLDLTAVGVVRVLSKKVIVGNTVKISTDGSGAAIIFTDYGRIYTYDADPDSRLYDVSENWFGLANDENFYVDIKWPKSKRTSLRNDIVDTMLGVFVP